MPSSVVRLVALDHRRLERLLERVCTPGPSRDRWQRELLHLLEAHQRGESSELYAPLAADWGEPTLDDVRVDSRRLAGAAQAVTAADLESVEHAAAVESLRAALTAHVDVTEHRLLPLVDERLERRRLRELGGRYEQRREHELEAVGGVRAVPRRLDYSRAELYELARKAGIEGRSSMTREELIDALMEQTPPPAATQPGAAGTG